MRFTPIFVSLLNPSYIHVRIIDSNLNQKYPLDNVKPIFHHLHTHLLINKTNLTNETKRVRVHKIALV